MNDSDLEFSLGQMFTRFDQLNLHTFYLIQCYFIACSGFLIVM